MSVSVMARLCVTLLTFCLMLYIGVQSQSKRKDMCIYQGDDDIHSFYQGGDVVLGGLFPLHSSPIALISSFRTKPKPTEYKLCVIVLSSGWCKRTVIEIVLYAIHLKLMVFLYYSFVMQSV